MIDLPRERLLRRGVAAASDEELLGLLIGTGVRDHPVRAIARAMLDASDGLPGVARASPRELAQIVGVGLARATRICAAFELGRRAVEAACDRSTVTRPADVFELVAPRLSGQKQEIFLVIGLDIRNQLLEILEVGRGSVHGVEVHPREIFRPLVRMAAAGGVLVHNHPSGDPTPSPEDIDLTRRLREVGTLVGIPIIDHVVVGGRQWRSLAETLGIEL
ncbi:MAG: DNA repair protein RadC [Proteobacteria bacterium]|nr:DNA repair protein RadC [Pseudomonadota bacterium]